MSDWDDDDTLTPDREAIRRHLLWLTEPARGAYDDALIEIAYESQLGAGPNRARLFELDEIDAAVDFAAARNAAGLNTYVGASLKLPDAERGKRSDGGDFYVATAVPIDIDHNVELVRSRLRAAFKDGFEVITGTKPSRRSQHWVRLMEPTDDTDEFQKAFEALVLHCGADAKVKDSARVMRLGGTINHPPQRKQANGYVQEVTQAHERENAPRVALEAILALKPSPDAPTGHYAARPDTGRAASGEIGADGFGIVTDGRESHFRNIVIGLVAGYQAENGSDPTEDDIWPDAFRKFTETTDNSDLRWTSEQGQRELRKRVRNTLRRLRDGRLGRFGLSSIDTGAGEEEARIYHQNRGGGQRASDPPPRQPVAHQKQAASGDDGWGDEAATAEEKPDALPTYSDWDIDPANIPPRPWIIPGFLIRKHSSILVAPGGAGKSLLTLQVAMALCAGKAWGGWMISQQHNVLVINAEDDRDEMHRRVAAARDAMDIKPSELVGRLHSAADPQSIVISRTGKDGVVYRTPLLEEIKAKVRKMSIDVLIVDPFAETFEGDENSNSEAKWAAALWREVARQCSCSVLLVHHTPKASQNMHGDVAASRGAGAVTNSTRVAATLFGMTGEEAATIGIPEHERHLYVRFDDAKANMSIVSGQARWFQKVSRNLPNGDQVGAMKPWKPPGLFDGFSVEAINQCLDVIKAGAAGKPYLLDRKGGNWVGNAVSETLCAEIEIAAKIVAAWMQSGLLFRVEFINDERKKRVGAGVDDSKRPGRS